MSLRNILKGIEKNHNAEFDKSGFVKDLSRGDFIKVKYYKLDFEDDEFHLKEGSPTSSFSMHIQRFSCEWSDTEYGTNAISDNGLRGEKTTICSDGTVSADGYIIGAWYNVDIVD